MKKILAVILALTCLFGLAGCQEEIVPPAPAPINDSESIKTSEAEEQADGIIADNDAVDYPTGDVAVTKSNLTMRTLKALVDRYGEDLTWEHFDEYYSEDIGSGLYILRYPIDANYCLLIGGGSTEISPMYIKLASANDFDNYIDVRTESVDDFID